MTVTVNKKGAKKRRRNGLKVVEVRHIQVHDAEERLIRVFKILMSSFENRVENDNRGR